MKLSFYYSLFFLGFFSCVHAVITITPEREFIKIQVPYSFTYQGIVIDRVSATTDLSKFEIVAFKCHKPSGKIKDTVTGSAVLGDIVGKALTCGIASALPWSDSAYYLAVYEIDPETKKQIRQLMASEIIKVRRARDAEIKKAHKKARELKQDIYAPLFLKVVTLKKRHVAAVVAAAVVVSGGLKLAYDWHQYRVWGIFGKRYGMYWAHNERVNDQRGAVLNVKRNQNESDWDYRKRLLSTVEERLSKKSLRTDEIEQLKSIDQKAWSDGIRKGLYGEVTDPFVFQTIFGSYVCKPSDFQEDERWIKYFRRRN